MFTQKKLAFESVRSALLSYIHTNNLDIMRFLSSGLTSPYCSYCRPPCSLRFHWSYNYFFFPSASTPCNLMALPSVTPVRSCMPWTSLSHHSQRCPLVNILPAWDWQVPSSMNLSWLPLSPTMGRHPTTCMPLWVSCSMRHLTTWTTAFQIFLLWSIEAVFVVKHSNSSLSSVVSDLLQSMIQYVSICV